MRSEAACLGIYLAITTTLLGVLILVNYWRYGHLDVIVAFYTGFMWIWVVLPAAICASALLFPFFQSGVIEHLPRQIAVFLLAAFTFSAVIFKFFMPPFEGP